MLYRTGRKRRVTVTTVATIELEIYTRAAGSSAYWAKKSSDISLPLAAGGGTFSLLYRATDDVITATVSGGVTNTSGSHVVTVSTGALSASYTLTATAIIDLAEYIDDASSVYSSFPNSLVYVEIPEPGGTNSVTLTLGGVSHSASNLLPPTGKIFRLQEYLSEWSGQCYASSAWGLNTLGTPSGVSDGRAYWQNEIDTYHAGSSVSDCVAECTVTFSGNGTGAVDTSLGTLNNTWASMTPSRVVAKGGSGNQIKSVVGTAKFRPTMTLTPTAQVFLIDQLDTRAAQVRFQRSDAGYVDKTKAAGVDSISDVFTLGGTTMSTSSVRSGVISSLSSSGPFTFTTTYTDRANLSGQSSWTTDGVTSNAATVPYSTVALTDDASTGGASVCHHETGGTNATITQATSTDYVGGAGETFSTTFGAPLRWTASSGAAVAVSGGILQFSKTLADIPGDPTRRILGRLSANRALGYRYLRVRIRSVGSANQPITFYHRYDDGFPNQITTTGADGVWVEREFDLWALPPSGSTPYFNRILGSSEYSDGFTITGLALGVSYELQWIRGVRKGDWRLRQWAYTSFRPESFWAISDGIGGYNDSLPFATTIGSFASFLTSTTKSWTGLSLTASASPATSAPLYDLPISALGTSGSSIAYFGGGGLSPMQGTGANASSLEIRTNGGITLNSYIWNQNILMYDGAGDPQASGSYGAAMVTRFRAISGVYLFGWAIAPGSIKVRPYGGGTTVLTLYPQPDGYFSGRLKMDNAAAIATNPTYELAADGSLYAFDNSGTFTGDPTVPTEPVIGMGSWGTNLFRRQHFLSRWYLLVRNLGGPLALDSARGWLYVAQGKRISAYHLSNALLLSASTDHSVDGWLSLAYDPRQVCLFGLADVGSGTKKLYSSQTLGNTVTEVLSVTANTIAQCIDSERSAMILLMTATSGANIQYRVSRNGGSTWSTAADIKDASNASVVGDVIDAVYDSRFGGVIVATFKISGSMVVWQSSNWGATWKPLLT